MSVIVLLLLVAAVVLLGLAAFGVNPVRPNLGWLGLTCLALVALLQALPL